MKTVAELDDNPHVTHPAPTSFKGLVPDPPPVAVELVELRKSLGGRPILNGVSLQVHRGETMCIIGGSGTGKSVTLKHVVGLLKPDAGAVLVDGVDITRPHNGELDAARRKIGFLFQGAALLNSLNVFENVALPLREHDRITEEELEKRVMEKLELVGLTDAVKKMPSVLSGGMKKRVGLARAIIRNPEIILYDEPTAGLDPVTCSSINLLILDMQEKLNVTSIVVTHDMSSVFRIADRIAMLYEGKILKVGTPDEFKQDDNPVTKAFIYGDSEGPLRRDKE